MPRLKKKQEVSTGYQPRPLQLEIHHSLKRFSVLAIHRRFGKTVLAVNEIVDKALRCKKTNPQFAYIAPYRTQAEKVAWKYIKEYTSSIPGTTHLKSTLTCILPNGAEIYLVGADNYDAIRGMYFDGVVLDEYGDMAPAAYDEVLRPGLADREGWALFIGTVKGKNHFHSKFMEAKRKMEDGDEEYFCATYRADETGVIPDKELESLKNSMSIEAYRQEMLCDWNAGVKGAFYSLEMADMRSDGRLTNVPYAKEIPVHVAFDLGVDDATAAFFFQTYREEVRILRYEEWTDTGLTEVLQQIQRIPYHYGVFYMPHDIGVREMTSGISRLDTIQGLGFDVEVVPKVGIADGIEQVRILLNRCWFDRTQAEHGVESLENYRKKLDKRTDTFLATPVHDKHSHGADAFRYLAVGLAMRSGGMSEKPHPLSKAAAPRVKRGRR